MLRYIVERISDGEFLELELPIVVSGAGQGLCSYGGFSGEIVPVMDVYKHAGTDRLIDPHGTFIHEEADGVIRGTWLVTRTSFDGAVWKIEGQGFSSYFSGYPYEGEYYGVQVDPIAVARHVVQYAQARTNSNIGVTVTGSSGVRVGTDSDLKAAAAKALMDGRKRDWDEFAKPRKALEARVKTLSKPHDDALRVLNRDRRVLRDDYASAVADKLPEATIAAKKALVDVKDVQVKARQALKSAAVKPLKDDIADLVIAEVPLKDAYEDAKTDHAAAKELASKDDGAWKSLWWDTPDCFEAFTEAVEAAGFEWVEWSGWNTARTAVLKEIRCVPRVGRKQTNLQFVEGDNVIESVVLEDDISEYANSVTVIGAGEGKDSLRFEVSATDGRRRTPVVVDAKHLTKISSVERLARAELARRQQKLKVAAIRVDASHPNAEKGTFGVGDVILVDSDSSAAGRQRLWRRITEVEWRGLDIGDLVLEDA